MKVWLKKTLFWVLAVVITLSASVYQRLTGPTYPMDVEFDSNGIAYVMDLPRSHGGETDCALEIVLPEQFSGDVLYRRFPVTSETWDTASFSRVADTLTAMLPHQPPAGKLEYHLELHDGVDRVDLQLKENTVIRFKGAVPPWALIPHILFMFFAMLWSNSTGLMAAAKIEAYKRHSLVTVILFVLGGLVFGPIVQKYAFGAYWTGWPFGGDLTDNKVLVSVLIWVAALVFNMKKERKWLVIVAALVLFAIYMIPHSMRGSELDYQSGDVVTGMLMLAVSTSSLPKLVKRNKLKPQL